MGSPELSLHSSPDKRTVRAGAKVRELVANFAPYFLKSLYFVKKQIESFHFNNLGRNFNLIVANLLAAPLTVSKDAASKRVVDFCDHFEIRSSLRAESVFGAPPRNRLEQLAQRVFAERLRESGANFHKLIEKEILECKRSEKVLEFELKQQLLEAERAPGRRDLKDLHVAVGGRVFKFYSEDFDNKRFFFGVDRAHAFFLKFRFNYFKNSKQVKVSTNYRFRNRLASRLFVRVFRKGRPRLRKNSSSKARPADAPRLGARIRKAPSSEAVGARVDLLFDKQLGPGEKVG